MNELGRLITAMVTPFDEEAELDVPQARRLAQALVASGSEGLVIAGTTGESPTLSVEEKLRLFGEVKSVVGSRAAVIAGTGNYSTAESVALTREAEAVGVDGALLVVPYYNKPSQEGLYQHFKTIAERTSLPCILYNVPSRTITSLAPQTVAQLSEIENIVGIKEASADLGQVARILDSCRPGFRVWSGNDSDTFPIMSLGGQGVISVASHLVGLQIRAQIEHTVAGNMQEAAAIHRRLLPLVNALFLVSNPVPVKYALNHVGFRVGLPRLPLVEPDAKTAGAIKSAVDACTVDLPVPAGAKG